MAGVGKQRHRILITLPDLFLGGGQRIVLNYLNHRDCGTFDVRILTLRCQPDDLRDEFEAAGVSITCLHLEHGLGLGGARELTALLRRDRIELLHPHGPDDRKMVLLPALRARVPVLFHLHSEWNHRGVHQPDHANHLRAALGELKGRARDRVEDLVVREYLADSQPVADSMGHHVRRPVHAMRQSMPFEHLREAAEQHDEGRWRDELGIGAGPVAISVSRLAEGKGQDRLIRAMASVRNDLPNAHLLLVGDGDLRATCERLVDDLDLRDTVHFLGTRRDVPRLLVGAQVFAFASATESFGLVVAEAMAACLPVVALRLPSLESFTIAGETGLFPAQDDDAGLASGLSRLLANPNLARSMGKAGYEMVARHFPPRATAVSFEGAYRRVLGLPPLPAMIPRAEEAPNPLALQGNVRLATKG
jgi:glycosyltransferase involved in cell wall biosynthesis